MTDQEVSDYMLRKCRKEAKAQLVAKADRNGVNARLGCNWYGRLDHITHLVEKGDDSRAREELRALAAFLNR